MEGCDIAARISEPVSRWCAIAFTPHPLYLYPLKRRLGGPQSGLGSGEKRAGALDGNRISVVQHISYSLY
jgi:hypothetical protein